MNISHTRVNNASFKCAVDFRKPFFLVKNNEKKTQKRVARAANEGVTGRLLWGEGVVHCSWLRIVAPVFEWGPEGVVAEVVVIYNSSVGF